MISTADPDARHTRKSPEARRDGYRAHLAADPETGIITDEKLGHAHLTTTEIYLTQLSGIASAGREAAGQLVSAGAESVCAPGGTGLLTCAGFWTLPLDA